MNVPLISIAIPAYNAEKYIEECLNSILNQTFQDWECIIINDGSTDNTLAIIENFVAKDERFSCYSIPNSGSAKIPRDRAISYAKAKLVMGIDADDFIDNDVLEKLYARAIETKADIVYLRMKLFDEENPENFSLIPAENFDMKRVLTGKEAVMLTIPKWIIGANGIVKKELWTAISTFNTEINLMNVDEYDTREMLIKAKTVAFEDVIYHYRQHGASITKKISVKSFETLITDKMLENLFSEHLGHNSLQKQLVSQYRMEEIISKRLLLFRMGSKLPAEERKRIKKKFFRHFWRFFAKFVIKYKLFRITIAMYQFFYFCFNAMMV
ncbi:MAG: glycosyltransferase [Fibromonadaceae bacterium]|jgi:glycosyltransferase involved in cell wall biosynthesis|nr:glycosyltransferase [Fibromonadaceae bacterium]